MTPQDLVKLPFTVGYHTTKFAVTQTPKVASLWWRRRKHPIVLVHGFLGFNRIGPIEYFQWVRDHLELMGYPTYTPTADPLNTFEYRGYEWFYGTHPKVRDNRVVEEADRDYHPRKLLSLDSLSPFVLRRLYPAGIAAVYLRHRRPVHVIAHSQACVDVRFLTAPEGLGNWKPFTGPEFDADLADVTIADTIASVTTIAGPHNGVLMADDTHVVTEFLEKYVFSMVNMFISLLSHDASDLYRAAREFGVEYMFGTFNRSYSDHPSIPYYSIAGLTNEYQVNEFLKFFYHQTRHNPKYEMSDNDGFVPLGSAKWPVRDGEHPRNVVAPSLLRNYESHGFHERNGSWSFLGTVYADHVHQIGLLFSYPRNTIFRHLPFFRGIARHATGELSEDVRLHPNGTWKVPRAVEMMPSIQARQSTTRSGL